MTTTPSVWKGLVQANTSDGGEIQSEGQVAGLPDGEYVVVWADNSHTYNSTSSAIVARRIDYAGLAVVPAGNRHGGEVKISQFNASGNQLAPAVAVLSNGNVAVAFHNNASTNDVYVRVFDSALNFVRTDIIDTGSNETYFAAITALAGGAYAVSYELGFGPPNSDIAGRIVDASGNVGSQFNIDNQSDNQSSAQLATLSNGNFVAVYQDELNGNAPDTNILVKIFTPAGTLVAGPGATPFSADSGRQTDPDVAALRDGGFVMVWSDDGNSLDGLKDIRAAVITNTGILVHDGIQVTVAPGDQDGANVVALADGGFLVSWDDYGADLVRAERFSADGARIGAVFTVNNGTSAEGPHAALLSDGRIAFAVDRIDSGGDLDLWESIYSIGAPNDFNANGLSDILWQNSNGTPAAWLMNGATTASAGAIGSFTPGPNWQIKASADFNGDGQPDILWQGSDGTPAIWTMNGTNVVSLGAVGPFNPGPSWQINGSADFNDDGKSDILWQGSDGTPAIWMMNGTNVVSFGAVGPFNPGPNWHIKATGDFTGGHNGDILWQSDDGTPAIWMMAGMNVRGLGAVGPFNPGPSWQIKATGDFNGDGRSDILWQGSDGTPAIWLMNGMNVGGMSAVGPFNPGPSWHVVGTGDYNGDNKADIVWQSDDGTPAIWFMDGLNFISASAAGSFNPGHDWHVIA